MSNCKITTLYSLLTSFLLLRNSYLEESTSQSGSKSGETRRNSKKCCNSVEDLITLRNLGQVKDLPGGGLIILSSPNLPSFTVPRRLKLKPIDLWEQADRIWLNM